MLLVIFPCELPSVSANMFNVCIRGLQERRERPGGSGGCPGCSRGGASAVRDKVSLPFSILAVSKHSPRLLVFGVTVFTPPVHFTSARHESSSVPS